MGSSGRWARVPGLSVLGGAAAGLSYEGAWRDALAREERDGPQARDAARSVAPPQVQRTRPGQAQMQAQAARQSPQ